MQTNFVSFAIAMMAVLSFSFAGCSDEEDYEGVYTNAARRKSRSAEGTDPTNPNNREFSSSKEFSIKVAPNMAPVVGKINYTIYWNEPITENGMLSTINYGFRVDGSETTSDTTYCIVHQGNLTSCVGFKTSTSGLRYSTKFDITVGIANSVYKKDTLMIDNFNYSN